ncbi:hypothetical protein ACFQ4M_12660 [Thauera mechernichensis]|uniref:Uncharacterized protein n=1 Tax=Thauera mechernichensis TaxID=82788 RepID=A0ABW3WEP6_9RHOO|nr:MULTISPECIES: hypothetical protein [Thauera]ENO83037.1 hypothetical protein B447_01501 [Thauera sp. 27]MDG3063782.1 hypothetical protein [Thauera mechernichensis]
MNIRTLLMSGAAVLATAASVVVLSAAPSAAESRAQGLPSLEPLDCVCSRGVELGAAGAAVSTLRNCQCGAMQCVVHVQSGHLQCR